MHLRVVVRVQVDETGSNDRALCVDHAVGRPLCASSHLRDSTVLDPEVTAVARYPGPINNRAVLDMDIERGHEAPRALAIGPT